LLLSPPRKVAARAKIRVPLYKEFDDFFENRRADEPRNLAPRQVIYFSRARDCRLGLGLVLLAAMGGLTQNG
jgi:hypothetical protein